MQVKDDHEMCPGARNQAQMTTFVINWTVMMILPRP